MEFDFIRYALKNYHTPYFSEDEFYDDIKRFVVIKKLLRRYTTSGALNERLLLNNIIIILNVFGIEAGNKLLFNKIEPEHHSILKTFLVFLNSYKYDNPDVPLDENIIRILENI